MKTFVFQGDSITDAGRSRTDDKDLGTGYPFMVSTELSAKYPGEYKFYNRGIGGDDVTKIYARTRGDIINLKPDYLSILIGVNGVWNEIVYDTGVNPKKYERTLSLIIEEVEEELPDTKIFIFEPYVLRGEDTNFAWERFHDGVAVRSELARRVAEKYSLPFIPLQRMLDEAVERTGGDTTNWVYDGVHPAPAGSYLIGQELIKCFEKNK